MNIGCSSFVSMIKWMVLPVVVVSMNMVAMIAVEVLQ
jgi:hypothetical protein